jgi:hypothetical protein
VNAAAPRSLALLTCALVALLATPAAAAPSPQALATKAFLARQKAARNAYRAALKAAETEAGLALRNVETGLASNGNITAAANGTFSALRDFQNAVQTAGEAAISEQADAARDALVSIGGDLAGHFPEAFYLSDGEPAALFQESLTSDLAKAYVRIRKRVGRIRSRFEAADFGFTFRIRAPHPLEQPAWREDFINGAGGFQETVDVLVGWSSFATDGDGQLRAAGSTFEDPIDVGADNGIDVILADDVVPFEGRYSTDFGGESFDEGSWVVSAGTGSGRSEFAIGMR